MYFNFYVTRTHADVMRQREDFEAAYERYPDATMFWAFCDLVNSSNYRIANGPKAGYIRGETFFALINATISWAADVRLIKEIGDAVLLTGTTFRPLFESLALSSAVAREIGNVESSTQYPFGLRAALGFGPAKRLMRRHEDFIGNPIDGLSRLMSMKSPTADLLISEDAYQPSAEILAEYPFATVSESKMLPEAQSKGMLKSVFYREIKLDYRAASDFRDHFTGWRGRAT